MAAFSKSDLFFILDQIRIAEAHAAGQNLLDLIPNTELPFGLRTVDGSFNHLVAGETEFGAADNVFPRMTDPVFRTAEAGTSYTQTSGTVIDSQPRTISNLIVDQTANNPAAHAAAFDPGADGILDTPTSPEGGRGDCHRHPRRRHALPDVLHPEHGARRGPVGALQLLDDLLRPVLRPRPRSGDQGRQRHGLHPAEGRTIRWCSAPTGWPGLPMICRPRSASWSSPGPPISPVRTACWAPPTTSTSTPTPLRPSSTRTRPTPPIPRTRCSCAPTS